MKGIKILAPFFYYKIIIVVFSICLLSVDSVAHQGEPSHGGDLPSEVGTNRMQYEGSPNLVDITISDNGFTSSDIAIDIGGMVAFENQDNQEHRIRFKTGEDDPNEEHDHPVVSHEIMHIIMPGKHWILSFLVPGLYPYECLLHGEKGQIYVRY